MPTPPTCPRCAGELRAPNLWSSAWRCARHGDVHPFRVAPLPSSKVMTDLAAHARVPVWVPWPLPLDWTVTGVASAGDERTGARATLVACSGPAPKGGPADVLFIAEEPGVGLGARFAGLAATDPGGTPEGPPDVKVEAAGHPTALWRTASGEDRAALAGEAKALWLWAVVWPDSAASALLDGINLHDLREAAHPSLDLVFGAPSPRL
ncbi:MAG: DUF6758 family protein [Mycobacteriales bacterium]|nr:phosphotransacetylase [Frankia sp.]